MTAEAISSGSAPWSLATQAAQFVAVDPYGLGGISIRGRAGPVRDQLFSILLGSLPAQAPVRRVPLNISDERLLGGLDLAATLRAGRPLAERGLLAAADGGLVVLCSAERIAPAAIARIASAMDKGVADVARDGFSLSSPTRFGVVALDEGIADDERPNNALLDRLAFVVDLEDLPLSAAGDRGPAKSGIDAARERLVRITVDDDVIAALCEAAIAMGVVSLRAAKFALQAARVAAALAGRESVSEADASLAAQLVLSPRATRLPAEDDAKQEQPKPADPPDTRTETQSDNQRNVEDGQLADVVLDAAQSAIPAGLLAALKAQVADRQRAKPAGKAGAKQKSVHRGRPCGVRRGELRSGARLNVVETLRAAAAWQPLRRKDVQRGASAPIGNGSRRRIEVRKDDFRMTRFKNQAETTTIFVVDASGSSALNRLAEAKGAVELLLAECYVRRDNVALIAFRGKSAELLLPPTRSLVRAKRCLASLPGGGGTPLAHGIDAAATLADATRRKGQTPTVIVLTDGRANIARDGTPGRPQAEIDSLQAARNLASGGFKALVIDISPKPAVQSERLAQALAAIYLPLPYADATVLSSAIKAAATTGQARARLELGN